MHTYSPYRLAALEPRALGLGVAGATLRAVTVAAALACGAGTSMAGDAALKITSFTVSADPLSGNFAFADDLFSNQLYNLSAKEAGMAAREAGARRLMLTHLWPRVDPRRSVAEGSDAFGEAVTLAAPHLVTRV